MTATRLRDGQEENCGPLRGIRRHLVRFAAAIDQTADDCRRADHGRGDDGVRRLGQHGADRRRGGRIGRFRRYRAEQDRPASRGRRYPRDLCARRRHRGSRPAVARTRRHRGTRGVAAAVPAAHQAVGHGCKAAGRDAGGAGYQASARDRQLAGQFARGEGNRGKSADDVHGAPQQPQQRRQEHRREHQGAGGADPGIAGATGRRQAPDRPARRGDRDQGPSGAGRTGA